MSGVKRVFVEKKEPFAVKAKELYDEITGYLNIKSVTNVRQLILDSLRLAHHGITVGTACTTVLHGEHDRIEDVDEDEHCQDGRCCKSIPVGAEELADRVVGYRPDNGY